MNVVVSLYVNTHFIKKFINIEPFKTTTPLRPLARIHPITKTSQRLPSDYHSRNGSERLNVR